jgi:hypothetical protein
MNPPAALTHHEIFTLAEPFVNRGHAVDLAASDRSARLLVFKPVACGSDLSLRATLRLDCGCAERFVLERELAHPAGVQATLRLAGTQAQVLLDALDSLPPDTQFDVGEGFVVARSYQVLDEAGLQVRPLPLFLCRGLVKLELLSLGLTLRMPGFRGVAGDIELLPREGQLLELPEDLLAVQGWDWARLERRTDRWTSKLRLRGNALRRSRTAEAALRHAATHLARVLADTPQRYHREHLAARWGVVLRRAIPTLTALGMIGGALLLPKVADTRHAGVWMALHYLPIALLALSFSLQELPQFEIPRWPRRPRAPDWRVPAAQGTAPGTPGHPA